MSAKLLPIGMQVHSTYNIQIYNLIRKCAKQNVPSTIDRVRFCEGVVRC